jgi:hypothetical protein
MGDLEWRKIWCHGTWRVPPDPVNTARRIGMAGALPQLLVLPRRGPHTPSIMARPRFSFSEEYRRPHTEARGCDEPGCTQVGEFRAPRSRNHLGATENYLWLCLDHVRAYNAAWNYYAGMSEREIEADLRKDTVWQRPTWPLGWRLASGLYRDPLNIFGHDDGKPGPGADRPQRKRKLTDEEKALVVFNLVEPFTLVELKRRYKALVKQHHPDANGGDKAAEERLKVITQAYAILKARFFVPTEP